MARSIFQINEAHLVFADTQVELDTDPDYGCQVTSAAVNEVPKDFTVPATGCAGETSIPGVSGFELAIAWMQDWNVSGGGLSKYLFDNRNELKWFRYTPSSTSTPAVEGECYIRGGAFGGEFGGAPAPASSTMGMPNEPLISVPA